MADASGTAGMGGGQGGSRGGPLPSGAPPATITSWPPPSWGPKVYSIDASGNRIPAVAPGPNVPPSDSRIPAEPGS